MNEYAAPYDYQSESMSEYYVYSYREGNFADRYILVDRSAPIGSFATVEWASDD